MTDWKLFHGNCRDNTNTALTELPDCPPWREFLPRKEVIKEKEKDAKYWQELQDKAKADKRSIERGRSFHIQKDSNGYSEIVDAVNAALHLRRPLLVTGRAGSGKTSLAYAITYELELGPVLVWPITARSKLNDALYRYDAIAHLQNVQIDKMRGHTDQDDTKENKKKEWEEGDLGDYIQLGPVGTAFLPSLRPRVLLIDEIDKSDLNLPNDLLNLFEEGQFEIPELVRRKRRKVGTEEKNVKVTVRSEDEDMEATIINGRVKCCEFPIVIMTSNGERDFPPAFYRRCLRVEMPKPTQESLLPIVKSHFNKINCNEWIDTEANLDKLIGEFLGKDNKGDRATDQLLNAIYLITRKESPSDDEMKQLKKLLFRRLSEGS